MREASSVATSVSCDPLAGTRPCTTDNGDRGHLDEAEALALGDPAESLLRRYRFRRGADRSSTIRALAHAIEAKDPSVRSHSEDVARYSAAVAVRMEIHGARREELLLGSLLHDVGKIAIPAEILLKPARLTHDEFAIVKRHPRIGHELVRGISALAGIALAILHHHERYDGGGYPIGLAGEEIPLEARIIGVADSFSAMTTNRPYSAGRTVGEACTELERCAGTQFDPAVVEVFVEGVRNPRPAETQACWSALNAL